MQHEELIDLYLEKILEANEKTNPRASHRLTKPVNFI